MSLLANIDHLAIAQGIVAVAVDSPTGAREFRGESSWKPVLDAALALLTKTGERTIRLVIGKHTVVLQQENEETVGVVLPTGHAIAKSLRRMIRRLSRKDRGPVPTRPVETMPTHATPSTPAASTPTSTPPSWDPLH